MPISKRNRRAIVLLILLSLIVIYTPRLISWLDKGEEAQISLEEIAAVENELINVSQTKKVAVKKRKSYNAPKQKFDPNDYSVEDWMALGLSEKQSNVILKFTQYGIRSNEGLKKIYVIPEDLYELIKDSTFYPVSDYKNNKYDVNKAETPVHLPPVELNTAAQDDLLAISGIGPYYSNKIITYRDKLGGYISQQQLLEIWKFDASLLDEIKEKITVDKSKVNKININTASNDQLAIHPYINYKIANSIVKMREQHGNYAKIEDIKRSKLIDEELFVKLKPYLTL